MKTIIVIPARYGSTRFGGKVLAKETGKYLVEHTYQQALCAKCTSEVIIATDSPLVEQACASFGAKCVMTSPDHQSGTDRIAEAVRDMDVELVINLQADEPQIEPAYIDYLARLVCENRWADMATLVADFEDKRQILDPNVVKVIMDKSGKAIYFSRSVIPYDRQAGGAGGLGEIKGYMRHLGIYAYRKDFLMKFTSLEQGFLEKKEKLEQLRAIENGFSIVAGKVEKAWDGIDTPQQYAEFVRRYKQQIY